MKELNLAKDILVQKIDNEMVIVSPSGGMITTVNETGAFLIKQFKTGTNFTEDRLVDLMLNEYNVSKETVINDVQLFLKEMQNHKIIA